MKNTLATFLIQKAAILTFATLQSWWLVFWISLNQNWPMTWKTSIIVCILSNGLWPYLRTHFLSKFCTRSYGSICFAKESIICSFWLWLFWFISKTDFCCKRRSHTKIEENMLELKKSWMMNMKMDLGFIVSLSYRYWVGHCLQWSIMKMTSIKSSKTQEKWRSVCLTVSFKVISPTILSRTKDNHKDFNQATSIAKMNILQEDGGRWKIWTTPATSAFLWFQLTIVWNWKRIRFWLMCGHLSASSITCIISKTTKRTSMPISSTAMSRTHTTWLTR